MMFYLLCFTLSSVVLVAGEHKVHNIVLYPERHSWCQTTPIRQVVAMPGYAPLTIDNHVCVGACYSYSIPRTQPAEPGELIGPYCDSCQPKTTQCYHVTLRRANFNANLTDDTQQMRKRVQIITDCSCSSCSRAISEQNPDECDLEDGNTLELPASLVAAKDSQEKADGMQPEVPELMAIPPPKTYATQSTQTSAEVGLMRTYHLSESLRRLLRDIQENDDNFVSSTSFTPEKLVDMRQLVEIIQGQDGLLTDRDVIDFVNWINEHEDENGMELDALKLKIVLDAFYRRELRLKHKKFGLGTTQTTQTENDDYDSSTHEHEKPLIEGSHLSMGHKKGAHITMGIRDNIIPSGDDGNEENDNTSAEMTDVDGASGEIEVKHHQHHVGDTITTGGSVAHLVMGPHGSLVLAAPSAEERLSLASDEVVPNQEGTVIDYHHHRNHHRSTPASVTL
ncbi:uncharacterized protein [Atheta coriaria]|uniref:uncharacterized protein n=1 Tax=Dalotia coriaria TaxID=877792 RepID=UPI0031F3E38D